MEKKNVDGKKKGVFSIPANYVTIHHLREHWMREKKEGKHMGKSLVVREGYDEQRKREEEEAMEPRVKLEDKSLGGSVEEIVTCESMASPAYIRRENSPVKVEILSVDMPNGENGVVRNSTGVETQFQDFCINKKVEGSEVKGPARLNEGQVSERKQRHEHATRASAESADGSGSEDGV